MNKELIKWTCKYCSAYFEFYMHKNSDQPRIISEDRIMIRETTLYCPWCGTPVKIRGKIAKIIMEDAKSKFIVS